MNLYLFYLRFCHRAKNYFFLFFYILILIRQKIYKILLFFRKIFYFWKKYKSLRKKGTGCFNLFLKSSLSPFYQLIEPEEPKRSEEHPEINNKTAIIIIDNRIKLILFFNVNKSSSIYFLSGRNKIDMVLNEVIDNI